MIRPADWPLIGVRPQPPQRTRKFVVEPVDGAWRVACAGAPDALFPASADAVVFACGRARDTAARGAVGLVVVKGDLHELHCFTPAAEPSA